MKAYVCNKCGRVITLPEKLERMTRLDFCCDKNGKYSEIHLCDDCLKEVDVFIREDRSLSTKIKVGD